MIKYFKNMILCSELDYHCLLCEESFEEIEDVEKHIRWETHRKNMKYPNCVRNYNEFVHKVRNIFYCEVCNSVVTTAKHVKTDKHKANKNKPVNRPSLGKRDASGLIKFPELTINRLQWHGISNGKCSLCNVTINNVNDHINSTKHMVNIIESEVIENEGYYYRKIHSKFHCISCAKTLDADTMKEHSCKEAKENKYINKSNLLKENCKPPTLTMLKESEKDLYDISIVNETAKCRICTVYVHPNFEDLYKHRKIYHKDTEYCLDVPDHGMRRSELKAYGKENFIKLNEGARKGYCSLCNINLSPHIDIAKDHVKGRLHMGHLELKGLIGRKKHTLPGYHVASLQIYLKYVFIVPTLNVLCINFSITLDVMSFMFITEVENDKQSKRKCFCCDMVLNCQEVDEHRKTRKHKNASVASDLLLVDNEFIRIIRPGLFHCGVCNKVFPFWECMNKHLNSRVHMFEKKKNELACTYALEWYGENEKNGVANIVEELYK